MNSTDFFKNNSYVVIKNFLPETLTNLYYAYTKKRCLFLDEKMGPHLHKSYVETIDGFRGDKDCGYSSYNFYADALTETICEGTLTELQTHTGIELVPTYGFLRMYQKGDTLPYHIDRKSCEISTSICIGHDISNVDKNVYPNYNWPIFLENKKGQKITISLNTGDMLIYKGCDLFHWRDAFLGNNHVQCFLHYNEKTSLENNIFDNRKSLGLPHTKNYIKNKGYYDKKK
jgi:hypothetical protein